MHLERQVPRHPQTSTEVQTVQKVDQDDGHLQQSRNRVSEEAAYCSRRDLLAEPQASKGSDQKFAEKEVSRKEH